MRGKKQQEVRERRGKTGLGEARAHTLKRLEAYLKRLSKIPKHCVENEVVVEKSWLP